jgi:hypothetical protein
MMMMMVTCVKAEPSNIKEREGEATVSQDLDP